MSASTPLPLPDDDAPALPDWPERASVVLRDEGATDALATRLAKALSPGQTLLLSGHLGAGKTHLARAMIRARLGLPDTPVPSPTFTLVQTYTAPDAEIWHADLYRLGDPGELTELGLEEAMGHAICLIEWPDRLAPDWPQDAAMLHLHRQFDETRIARLLSPADTPLAQAIAE
ncbi:tRNA (adenosine(37)-N6)-threonylcarbamoyltransferase complex ATPase subunit type 1 TsaE [Hasllibacter sp. MH4015]|uniref:tRNA (adenosine(37)-N6)-threonylcarbamoyltransferase complex ATPase subunit type 1 TsaE n=1 Tax=Hasllibacter sp. MH4015 TaxID=2854029 RepID=UPI001CD46848|nr:tRNA (adenosine(37)-N6)-threonylcarbamoyltransferase complex ATPase subunit type 1 TsaE [Hasllibacter sp. MH4015]